MKSILTYFLILCCFTLTAQQAQDTKIIVRTKAKDAKFIGTSMGGSLIMIKDATTGEILTKGLTKGGTGNTDLIMNTPKERYLKIADAASAFETTLSIAKPQFVTIEAHAPVNQKNSSVFAQTQVWLIPGKHIDGDGIILEIPGFVIEGLYPQTHQGFSIENDKSIELKANMVMMCGCPITEGGLWDSNDIEVNAMVYVNGEYWKTISMSLASANTYTANLDLEKTGSHEVIITGYHSKSKNTGANQINFRVSN